MNKIITTQEKQTAESLNIRYIFTFIKKIQTDLERRYNEFQEKLNKKEITNPSVELTYDGSKWL